MACIVWRKNTTSARRFRSIASEMLNHAPFRLPLYTNSLEPLHIFEFIFKPKTNYFNWFFSVMGLQFRHLSVCQVEIAYFQLSNFSYLFSMFTVSFHFLLSSFMFCLTYLVIHLLLSDMTSPYWGFTFNCSVSIVPFQILICHTFISIFKSTLSVHF